MVLPLFVSLYCRMAGTRFRLLLGRDLVDALGLVEGLCLVGERCLAFCVVAAGLVEGFGFRFLALCARWVER